MTTDDPRVDVDKLKTLLPEHCRDVELLARGKRGVLLKAKVGDQDVAIKMTHPSSKAHNALLKEAQNLKRVNKLGVGPKLIEYTDEYVIMEFVPGTLIGEYLADKNIPTREIKEVLARIIDQIFILDKNRINKQEMTKPYKHIIVKDNLEPVLIDFERAKITLRPANMTQFSQYLISSDITASLNERGLLPDKERFYDLIREYHNADNEKKEDIVEEIKQLL
ncbi:MAG: RIO1 family regulatory kinase/ATPase [Nanobdellota archaeon]